ncbi:amidohydrolase family protein, partial [Chloroflexota bacterium]
LAQQDTLEHEKPYLEGLPRRPIEYFHKFYNDTAVFGSTPALMCGYAFFGADHILFGTDMPFDAEHGHRQLRETIRSIEQMDIPKSDREKIYKDNARQLFRLTI